MDVVQVIKDHPIPIAGGVILLIILMKGSSSSTPQVVSTTAANNSYALQSQKLSNDANLGLSSINAQASVKRASITEDAFKTSALIAAEKGKNDMSGMVSMYLGMLSNNTMQQESADKLDATKTALNTQAKITALTTASDIQRAQIGANTVIHGIDSSSSIAMRAADNQAYALETGRKGQMLEYDNLPAVLASRQALAVISSNTTSNIVGMNLAAQRNTVNTTAGLSIADMILRAMAGGSTKEQGKAAGSGAGAGTGKGSGGSGSGGGTGSTGMFDLSSWLRNNDGLYGGSAFTQEANNVNATIDQNNMANWNFESAASFNPPDTGGINIDFQMPDFGGGSTDPGSYWGTE